MVAKANPVTVQAFQESGEGSFHVGKKQNNKGLSIYYVIHDGGAGVFPIYYNIT